MIQDIRIFHCNQYEERTEKQSQQDKLSKFCMDAGFLSVVDSGQYFMTKDTGDLTQFHAVTCHEYTLPRDDDASQPRGWIQRRHQNWTSNASVTTECKRCKRFCEPSKGKAKPQRREPSGSSLKIISMERRNWIHIEPTKISL